VKGICQRVPNGGHLLQGAALHHQQGPKARPIPAWGNAPGTTPIPPARAKGPFHTSLGQRPRHNAHRTSKGQRPAPYQTGASPRDTTPIPPARAKGPSHPADPPQTSTKRKRFSPDPPQPLLSSPPRTKNQQPRTKTLPRLHVIVADASFR
jgi:hypothetical protein